MALLLILVTPIVWAIPSALMAAELGSAIPSEGGYYAWVRRAFGPFWGFQCAWWTWVYSWVDVAIYPVLFATYVVTALKLFGWQSASLEGSWAKWGIGMAIILPLTVLNVLGVKRVGNTAVGFGVLLTLPFLAMIALGLPKILGHPSAAFFPIVTPGKAGFEAFSTGLFVVMWNYLGWDTMSTVAGEVEEPQRTYPKALAVAVPIIMLSYLFPMLVGGWVLRDPAKWEAGAWTQVAAGLGGFGLALAVTLGGVLSSAGQFTSMLLACSRIPFVLSEERVLPPILTKLHPRYGTPIVAILVSAVFYSFFSFGSFRQLAEVDVVIYSAGLLLEFGALFVLRRREPELVRPFKIPGGWFGLALVITLPTLIVVAAIVDQLRSKDPWLTVVFTLVGLSSGPTMWMIRKKGYRSLKYRT